MMEHQGIIPLGVKIIVNDLACIKNEWRQVRFPKSRKKRIRRKWAKKRENFGLKEVHHLVRFGDTVFISDKMRGKLMQTLPVMIL